MTPRGPKFLRKFGKVDFRIVGKLRLLLGVEVVEIAVELGEAMGGRQHLVLVAQMVLAELPGGIALRLQEFGQSRIFFPEAEIGPRQPDLTETSAEHTLASDERRAARRTALLTVVIGEQHPLLADRVDVGRAIAHQPVCVGADIRVPDIVAPDDDNVGLLVLLGSRLLRAEKGRHDEPSQTNQGEPIGLPAHG
jgi:hypothetical protein